MEDDMARTKACLGRGARLTDYLSISLLARMYPASLIGKLLDAHHCNSRRERGFPATAVAYYCMALSLYPEAACADVFDAVAQGLAWRNRGMVPPRIKSSSISVARSRFVVAGLQAPPGDAVPPLGRCAHLPTGLLLRVETDGDRWQQY